MDEQQATWVYAVTRDLDPAVLADLDGIGGEEVRTLPGDPLTAVIGAVDADAFSEEAFEGRLSDPGELEAIARAHHRVVEAVASARPALPLRLATVYRDGGRVREMLTQRHAEFARTLDWLSGRTECGVKVWADPQAVAGDEGDQPAAGTPGNHPAGGGEGAGAAYLSRRRARLAARDSSRQRAAEHAEEVHAELSGMAVAACRHRLQDTQMAGDHGLMVLNAAYLVELDGAGQFAESARTLAGELAGFRLEVTGPWPPYSFADGPEGLACLVQRVQTSPPAHRSRRLRWLTCSTGCSPEAWSSRGM
jgi:hypothetical protein